MGLKRVTQRETHGRETHAKTPRRKGEHTEFRNADSWFLNPVFSFASWCEIFSGAGRFFDDEMIHDVFPALGSVFTHIKLEQRLNGVSVIDRNRSQAHVGPNKMLEFRG